MLDTYIIGEHHRQSPEADCPVLNVTKTEHRLGGAADVALNLLHLEQNPILIGVISQDENGEILKTCCQEENINYHFFVDSDRPTTCKKRFVDADYKQFLRTDTEESKDISSSLESEMISHLDKIDVAQIDLILIQDYNKGVLTPNVIAKIQSMSLENDIKLCVDPKHSNFTLLSKCTLFKPNLKELERHLQKEIAADKNELDQALNTSDLTHNNCTVVTLSENGIYYKFQEESGLIEGQKIRNADVSGAGDTVISILAISLISEMELKNMIILANSCGAFVCQMKGISTIKMPDLQTIADNLRL